VGKALRHAAVEFVTSGRNPLPAHREGYSTYFVDQNSHKYVQNLAVSGEEKHSKMLSFLYMKGNSKNRTFAKIVLVTTFKPQSQSLGKKFLASCDNSYRK
jgi:hypothetical protein